MMKRVITVLIVLVLIAAGVYAYSLWQAGRRAQAISNLQTEILSRGNLVATIGATGTVRANQTAILAWQTSGSVEAVLAEVGEDVTINAPLAILDQASLPQNIILAGADLVSAQNDLEQLLEPASELEITRAEQAIASAQETVRDLQQYVNNLKSSSSQADIDQARATVVLAQNKLDEANEDFQPYANKPEDNLVRATLLGKLALAQKEYDGAVTRLNNLLGTANAVDLAVAESDLALAQAQLKDAQEAYDTLLAGPDADDIAAAEARVAAAQATVDLMRLEAPFAATVTEVQVKPGDQIAPGTLAFRLDDLTRILVDVMVPEVDINRIRHGQEVVVTFDAIPAGEYHGRVTQVALVGTARQDVVDFAVTVELTDADEKVKPGITAAVNVVVEELQDVLLVPNRAVRLQDGQRVVYILQDGSPQPVEIDLGASSDVYSEVVGGDLRTGARVVLNPPVEFEQSGPPPFVRGGQ
jgi:HlyD family secretion protein